MNFFCESFVKKKEIGYFEDNKYSERRKYEYN